MPRTLPRRDAFPDGGAGGALQAQARTRTVRRRRLLAGNIGFSRRAEKKGTRRSPEHRSQGARKSEKMGCKEDSQPGPRPAPDVGARVPGRGGSRHAEASFSRLKQATREGPRRRGQSSHHGRRCGMCSRLSRGGPVESGDQPLEKRGRAPGGGVSRQECLLEGQGARKRGSVSTDSQGIYGMVAAAFGE